MSGFTQLCHRGCAWNHTNTQRSIEKTHLAVSHKALGMYVQNSRRSIAHAAEEDSPSFSHAASNAAPNLCLSLVLLWHGGHQSSHTNKSQQLSKINRSQILRKKKQGVQNLQSLFGPKKKKEIICCTVDLNLKQFLKICLQSLTKQTLLDPVFYCSMTAVWLSVCVCVCQNSCWHAHVYIHDPLVLSSCLDRAHTLTLRVGLSGSRVTGELQIDSWHLKRGWIFPQYATAQQKIINLTFQLETFGIATSPRGALTPSVRGECFLVFVLCVKRFQRWRSQSAYFWRDDQSTCNESIK